MDMHISGDSIKLDPLTKENLSMINLWYCQNDSFGYATGGKNPEEVLAGLNDEHAGFVLGIYPTGTEGCIGLIAGEIKSVREPVLWVRTFLIDTLWQRRHYGSTAFQLLAEYIARNYQIKRVFVSVAVKNRVGMQFWKSLGFRCVRLFYGSSGHNSTVYIFEKVIHP
ncbi:MAG: GNAT family N-acetyltransferase [Thermoclostridium sp.]|nr:GNAT family N-acetyltransferase [Thermoclostridium sp.]